MCIYAGKIISLAHTELSIPHQWEHSMKIVTRGAMQNVIGVILESPTVYPKFPLKRF
jgi:hypothetical protein